MKKILFILLMVYLLMGSNVFASAFFPAGGDNNDIIGKAGDAQEDNDFHHKFLNVSRHNELLGIDKDSLTTWIPKTAYAPATHTHTVNDLSDIIKYKIPTCVMAERSAKCDKAVHADTAGQAKTSDMSLETKKCDEADIVDISDIAANGLPSGDIAGNSIMAFDTSTKKFVPVQQALLPNNGSTAVKDGILVTDGKGTIKLATKDELFKKIQDDLKGYETWGYIAAGSLGLILILLILNIVFTTMIPVEGCKVGDRITLKWKDSGTVEEYVIDEKTKWYPGNTPIYLKKVQA